MSEKKEILVAKFGSSALTGPEGTATNHLGVSSGRIAEAVFKLANLTDRYRLVVVHSGAVAVGKNFAIETVGEEAAAVIDDVDRAAAGSALIAAEFQDFFREKGILSVQMLLTHKEIEGKKVGSGIVARIKKQLSQDRAIVPLINENDIVSDEELKKLAYGGDNDGLASHIARAIDADKLLLLTNRDGFEVDGLAIPRLSYDGDFDYIVDNIDESIEEGTGGIFSKVENAAEFVEAGEGRMAYIGNMEASYEAILGGEAGTRVVR